MDSSVLLAYASLAASRTLLEQLLACLNFSLKSKIYPFDTNKKSDFYELWHFYKLWQQHMQLKTTHPTMLSMRDIYNNSNLNPPTKFTSSSWRTKFKEILPWNISQMITKTIPLRTRVIISYAMKQHSVVNLIESQWKLRQEHDQNFPMEGKRNLFY